MRLLTVLALLIASPATAATFVHGSTSMQFYEIDPLPLPAGFPGGASTDLNTIVEWEWLLPADQAPTSPGLWEFGPGDGASLVVTIPDTGLYLAALTITVQLYDEPAAIGSWDRIDIFGDFDVLPAGIDSASFAVIDGGLDGVTLSCEDSLLCITMEGEPYSDYHDFAGGIGGYSGGELWGFNCNGDDCGGISFTTTTVPEPTTATLLGIGLMVTALRHRGSRCR